MINRCWRFSQWNYVKYKQASFMALTFSLGCIDFDGFADGEKDGYRCLIGSNWGQMRCLVLEMKECVCIL